MRVGLDRGKRGKKFPHSLKARSLPFPKCTAVFDEVLALLVAFGFDVFLFNPLHRRLLEGAIIWEGSTMSCSWLSSIGIEITGSDECVDAA